MSICAFITFSFGWISQIINPLKMMLTASLSMSLFSFPFFFLIELNSFYCLIIAELTLILLSQCFVSPAFTIMAKLFPYEIRYKGIALGNCLGLSLFGGVTPYISAYLIKHTTLSWSPAFYLSFIATLGFLSVLVVLDKSRKGYLFNL